MTEVTPGVWSARVLAVVLVVALGWVFWGMVLRQEQAPHRQIWIKPGQYQGPAHDELDPGQVDAIDQRTQNLNY